MNQLRLTRSRQEWWEKIKNSGAYWAYDARRPQEPHAELTSGRHSDQFVDLDIFLQHGVSRDEAASDLVTLALKAGLIPQEVDQVVGPAMGAIKLAGDIGRNLELQSRHRVLDNFCEKREDKKMGADTVKYMVVERPALVPGDSVLLSEDVVTTGESVGRMIEAVRASGAKHVPFLCTVVNRSDQEEIAGLKVISLTSFEADSWLPEDCPLCKQGSKALKPKGVNWYIFSQRQH